MSAPRRNLRRALLIGTAAAGAEAIAASPARADGAVGTGAGATTGTAVAYEPARPGRALRFPRDFGMHPDFRTEWWYVTGWLDAGERAHGFQLTFFRSRTTHDPRNPSRFAPTQLLLAHAAVAEEGAGVLRHDQRSARAGFGLAAASEADTEVAIGDDWRLARTPDDRYRARIRTRDFTLELTMTPPGPPVLQGEAGFSRKGPLPAQASHYYSRPKLAVEGRLLLTDGRPRANAAGTRGERALAVRGRAWLDHEWSSELLDPRAAGWDWVGLDLDDGTALMAFRIRARDGGVLWSDAHWIGRNAPAGAPLFKPLRTWRSPRSGADWPVAMRLEVGGRILELRPLFDDQELDTRASTGTIYWEGAVRVFEDGRGIGRGYLELTGYAGPLRL